MTMKIKTKSIYSKWETMSIRDFIGNEITPDLYPTLGTMEFTASQSHSNTDAIAGMASFLIENFELDINQTKKLLKMMGIYVENIMLTKEN